MSTDPRMAERRREVAELNARRSLRRLVWLLVVLVSLGGVGWVAQSPWFSVSELAVSGVVASDTDRILAETGVLQGRPLVTIRAGAVEEALQEDPWIAAADVRLILPNRVEVVVVERTPVAWVFSHGRWAVVSADVTLLRFDREPSFPRVLLGDASGRVSLEDERVRGAVGFLSALPAELATTATIMERDGELWAEVGSHTVRLGSPVDMDAKAAALVAIAGDDIAPGTLINLVAPTRPAVEQASTSS